jgi:hypothetical protein
MVMAIPGVIALLLVRSYTTDIVFFVGMGFSFKIAKKIADKMNKNKTADSR